MLPTPAATLAGYFLLSSRGVGALLVGATMLLGEGALRTIFGGAGQLLAAFSATFALATLALHLLKPLLNRPRRRYKFQDGVCAPFDGSSGEPGPRTRLTSVPCFS